MMTKKQILITCMALVCALATLHAQQAPVAAGGNAAGSGGSLSYSIGQVAYTTCTSVTGTGSAGVQQAYELFVLTGTKENSAIELTASAYPNPAAEYIVLNVPGWAGAELFYQLSDTRGNVLFTGKVRGPESKIDMCTFAPAIYFLKVWAADKALQSFKIVKNN